MDWWLNATPDIKCFGATDYNWVQRAGGWIGGLIVSGLSVDLQFGHEEKVLES
jgi:hypothetical protein